MSHPYKMDVLKIANRVPDLDGEQFVAVEIQPGDFYPKILAVLARFVRENKSPLAGDYNQVSLEALQLTPEQFESAAAQPAGDEPTRAACLEVARRWGTRILKEQVSFEGRTLRIRWLRDLNWRL